MDKITAVVGQTPEKFSQRRRVPRLPLIIVVLLVGTIGGYILINSFADTSTCTVDLDQLTVSAGCPVVKSDTAASGDDSVIESLWGNQIQCVDPSRVQVLPTGGDPHNTANGTPQGNTSYYQMQVLDGDDFYGSRCELGQNERRYGENGGAGTFQLYQQGEHKITFVSIKLPAGFQANQDMWQTIMQMKQTEPDATAGSSPILELDAYDGKFMVNSDPGGTLWTTPVVVGQWVRFAFDVTYSQNSDGSLKIYADLNGNGNTTDPGEQSPTINTATLATETTPSEGDPVLQTGDPVPSHLRLGLYHNPSYSCPAPNGCTIDDDNIQVVDLTGINAATTTTPPSTGSSTTTPPPDTTPPTVSLSSPASGSTVSGQVSLTANASDNVGVSKVEFYADGTLVGTSTTAPYTATWNAASVVAGTHTITAKAYDAAGNVGTSSAVTVNTAAAPTASQLVLDTGGFESGTLNNWNISGVGDVVPTVVSDIVRNGSKSLEVKLTGTQGRSELILGGNGSASTAGTEYFHEGDNYYYAFSIYINQMVYGGPGGHNIIFQLKGNDQLSPDLALQLWNSPGAASDGSPGGKGLWYSGAAEGSDRFISPISEQQWHDIVVHFVVSNQGAGSDQIYLDGKLIRSDTNVDTMPSDTSEVYIKNGLYRNGATVSGTSDIRLDDAKLGTSYAAVAEPSAPPVSPSPPSSPTPTPDTTPPTVSFASPAANATVSGIVTATANASDNVGVSKVEFYADGSSTPAMTDTSAPYNYSFDSKTLGNGSHSLTAKAYDAAGNTASSTVNFTVNNADTTPPSTPTNVKATATNATTVNLTWSASTDTGTNATGVAKYNILRNGVVIAQVTTTSYTDTSAVASTAYGYSVQAVDGAGNVSSNSSTVNVTTPAATTTNQDLLFNGTHISDYSNQSAPGAVTEVPDPAGSNQTVFKMVVNNTDVAPVTPTDNPRAQLVGPSDINIGDNFWLESKFYLPSDFPSDIPGWMAMIANYGPPFNGSSPWSIDIDNSSIEWQRNLTYNWDIPWGMPIVKNQWVNVLVHQDFDTSNGFVEMWVNGKPITFFDKSSTDYYNPNNVSPTTHLAMQTADPANDGGANSGRIMQYREVNMFDTVTTYSGPLIIGKTEAAVDAANAADGGTGSSTTTPPPTPEPDTTAPSVPAALVATATSATQVNLTWNASTDSGGSGLAGYNVYRGGKKLNSSLVTTTSYGDATVSGSTTYSYTVQAVDGAGNTSAQTSAVNVTTLAPPKVVHHHKSSKSSASTVTSGTASVTVTVTGVQNKPASGASVTVGDQTAVTNNKGVARFNSLASGKQPVAITYNGKQVSRTITVSKSATQQSPQLFKLSAIHTLSPVLLLIPILVLLGAGGFLVRPWQRLVRSSVEATANHVVTSDDTAAPSQTPAMTQTHGVPGTVYGPEKPDEHHN